jgi:hypothetical protein
LEPAEQCVFGLGREPNRYGGAMNNPHAPLLPLSVKVK